MTPTPVLLVDHASGMGGAEHSLLRLIAHVDRRAWEVHVACAAEELAAEVERAGGVAHRLPMPRLRRSPLGPLALLRGARALAELADSCGAALIHGNTVRASIYAALAARWARRPWIWHMRDFYLGEGPPRLVSIDRAGKMLLAASAARVIANSRAVGESLPVQGKVTVIYNGVDLPDESALSGGEGFRRAHGIALTAPVVGMVGRLRPWKGQDRFLRAMAVVARHVPSARFLIVGGSPLAEADAYERALRRLAADLGLGASAIFTGHLSDVRPALAAMDVFVHPGDPEPFGLVNIEAMAMQRPVVGFRHGALPEIVVDGETGTLVRPVDERALAEAVIALLGDPQARLSMGRAARARVAAHFTADRMARQVEAVWREVIG